MVNFNLDDLMKHIYVCKDCNLDIDMDIIIVDLYK